MSNYRPQLARILREQGTNLGQLHVAERDAVLAQIAPQESNPTSAIGRTQVEREVDDLLKEVPTAGKTRVVVFERSPNDHRIHREDPTETLDVEQLTKGEEDRWHEQR